jgi:hypothetical protein
MVLLCNYDDCGFFDFLGNLFRGQLTRNLRCFENKRFYFKKNSIFDENFDYENSHYFFFKFGYASIFLDFFEEKIFKFLVYRKGILMVCVLTFTKNQSTLKISHYILKFVSRKIPLFLPQIKVYFWFFSSVHKFSNGLCLDFLNFFKRKDKSILRLYFLNFPQKIPIIFSIFLYSFSSFPLFLIIQN